MISLSPATLPYPILCLVTDPTYGDPDALLRKVASAVDGGVNMVQLRDKAMPTGKLFQLAQDLRRVTQGKALLIINNRLDVALAAGADGVQLGEDALPVDAARKVAGGRLLLGRSVHSVEGAASAEKAGADFLLVGAIFPTGSHPGAAPAGLALLAQAHATVRIPFLAIGGVDAASVSQVMAQGAAGAAVISAILAQPDHRAAARSLKEAMIVAATRFPKVVSSR